MFSHLPRLRFGPRLTAAVACALVLIAVPAVPAAAPETLREFDQQVRLDYRGNGTVQMKWTFTPEGYAKFKDMLSHRMRGKEMGVVVVSKISGPTVPGVLSFLGLHNLPYQVDNLTGEFNDKECSFTARFEVAGWAKTRGPQQWYLNLLDNLRWHDPVDLNLPPIAGYLAYSFKGYDPATSTATLEMVQPKYRSRLEITLPAGARQVTFRKRANGLYALFFEASVTASTAGMTDGQPEIQVEPKPVLVPALHKLYGDPVWGEMYLARLRFMNRSRQTVTGLRARLRIQTTRGKTDCSEWQELGASVSPGQEVQAPLHAILDANVCMLENPETARIYVEYQYETADGRKESRTILARTRLLGRHDSLFTQLDLTKLSGQEITYYHLFRDAPVMVTALTMANDQAIKELKGKVSHQIGGKPPVNDVASRAYLEALYNLMRANITYVFPTGTVDRVHLQITQHHYLGRDVLRFRSGTCIDLAMLTAATAEASGMEPYIVLIPGHAFPAVRLPESKKLFFVEATGCAGGEMKSSFPFGFAAKYASAEYDDAVKKGEVIVVDVRFLRQFVAAPELPAEGGADPLAGLRTPPAKPVVSGGKVVAVKENVERNGRKGMEIRVRLDMTQAGKQSATVFAVVHDAAGRPIQTVKTAYSTPVVVNGQPRFVAASAQVAAGPSGAAAQEVVLFLPYEAIPAAGQGGLFRVEIKVWSEEYKEWVELPVKLECRVALPEKAVGAVARLLVPAVWTALTV